MSKGRSYKTQYKLLLILLFLLLFVSILSYFYLKLKLSNKSSGVSQSFNNLSSSKNAKSSTAHNNNDVKSPAIDNNKTVSKPKDSIVTISAVGDCTIGTDPNFNQSTSLPAVLARNSNSKYYLFKNVRPIFMKDDITIANLETTFTTSNNRQVKKFTFKGNPSLAASIPAASIEGVNISNNHIHDFGTQGFNDTISTLKKYNTNYFGEGNVWETKVNNIKIAFLGYTGWSNDSAFLTKLKTDIKRYKSKNDMVIITFHWGIERNYLPNYVQKNIAHTAINAGASLIIGHHPHVLESIEKYKGKYICYSLGNFCFGGNSNPPDKDTIIFQSKFSINPKGEVSSKIRVIPCSISSVSSYNDYCPTPLSGTNKSRVLNKLNNLNININFKLNTNFQ